MPNHDAIVIGTGQSGPALARRLVAAGQKVAVIERKFFGGTCVNTGCTPTKALVASAYAAHLARRAGDYGVTIGGPVGGRHEGRQGAQGRHRGAIAQRRGTLAQDAGRLHGLRRPRPVCRGQESRSGNDPCSRPTHLHQCGRASIGAADPRPRSGSLSHQQLDDGRRFPAPASDHLGRQLHRP